MEAVGSNNIWYNKTFRRIFLSSLLTTANSKIYSLAIPLLIYQLTESSEAMGLVRALEYLPNLVLGFLIGVFIDRVNRKRWSLISLASLTIYVFSLYAMFQFQVIDYTVMYILVFLFATSDYTFHVARSGIIKCSLSKDNQQEATSKLSALNSFFETVGPSLAGLILLLSDLHYVFLLMFVLYLACIPLYSKLEYVTASHEDNTTSFVNSLKEGWKHFRSDKYMLDITVAVVIVNMCGAVFLIQSIFLAQEMFDFSAVEVGYFVSLSGIGGLIGAYFFTRARRTFRLGRVLLVTMVLECIGFVAVVVYPLGASLLLSALYTSLFGTLSSICIWTYRQESFSEHVISSVSGLTGSLFKIGIPCALFASGYVMSSYGYECLFISCFIFQLLAAVYLFFNKISLIK
ncbi:hypothetical protein VCSRO97_3345 [Vibrio cholerae]|nr:hypothetical protein VCSRO97_3345 [Vibrio cholerae]